MKLHAPLLAALLCLPLLACGDRNNTADPTTANGDTLLGQTVRRATEAARAKLATENISISHEGTPKAEITPSGDLLIDGKAITLTDAQRALVLHYREQIMQIASAGMDIGVQGANLGMRAAGDAIKGVLSGNADQIEGKINAEAAKIKAEARKLCDLVPPLRQTQDALAQALPEFAPYARNMPLDPDECLSNGGITVP